MPYGENCQELDLLKLLKRVYFEGSIMKRRSDDSRGTVIRVVEGKDQLLKKY